MRIPVHPEDLIRNRGFKSLAKQLRKSLQGPSTISLALAEDILAKGFGYESYYDLEQTTKAGIRENFSWTENDARLVMRIACCQDLSEELVEALAILGELACRQISDKSK